MEGVGADCAALVETTVFLAFFRDMPDHRQPGKVIYPLDEILLFGVIAEFVPNPTLSSVE